MTEAETRAQRIDHQLSRAGWNVADCTQVQRELPLSVLVTSGEACPESYGITDDCLMTPSGEVLAVVEAKRSSRSEREGEEQLRLYVQGIAAHQSFAPFGFMSNGYRTSFWEVGQAHPRLVAGFFRREDLMRLLHLRRHGLDLASLPISNPIANRPYQHEAIRRVAEHFATGARHALLVMATGTGKTRTTMALIDLFLRAGQAQKVLFVADRDALVEQALTDGFMVHLPEEPRGRIYTRNIDPNLRLYVATLQTLSNCYEQINPGFFDLIVFDEAHRSIFNRFHDIVEYFDARMIGLTATPATFIDRDTFRVFRCTNNRPTFLYGFEEAVNQHFLVDFRVNQAQTGFQRDGIHGATLDEEAREGLIANGIDPDDIDYEGTEIEKTVSNRDTLRRQWEEIMEQSVKDPSGLICKTIVFAMSREHANRLREVFEEMYPQHVGLLTVIHHGVERVHDGPWGRGLINRFKHENHPRIAISVDMLDTGVDVPEVMNLVFMRPVQSRIKLWQMIGRGTRSQEACNYPERLPANGKNGFLILDFWQNDFGRRIDPPQPAELPILVRLFRLRVDLLEAARLEPTSFACQQAIRDLRAMLARVPVDSFLIQREWHRVERAWRDHFWQFILPDSLEYLRTEIAPLLRHVSDVDLAAESFTLKVEALKLDRLRRRPSTPEALDSVVSDVARLPEDVHQNAARQASIGIVLSSTTPTLADATPQQLTQIITDLAGEMKRRRSTIPSFRILDLPDFLMPRSTIILGPGMQPVYVNEYRQQVEARIQEILATSAAIAALQSGRQPPPEQLVELERLLHEHLGEESDLHLSSSVARRAFGIELTGSTGFLGFIRNLLDIAALPTYAEAVESGFNEHITAHAYSADQIRFLRAVQEVFVQRHSLQEADLYDPPFTQFGRNAADRLFTPQQKQSILDLTHDLAA
jgi:type I restriction enzyme R subunit